ncbi:spliceosome associated factor 3, U4/U6 recycling protein-like isoform X1 [Styela clava]
MEVEERMEEEDKEEDELSSDEDVEEESLKEIEELNEKLSRSPFDYHSHITIIKLLRKTGELEKLRDARNVMAKIFPLTQALWLEWIEDEKKYAESEEDHNRIVELFEKAVKDYICPEVWLEYAQYSIRWLGSEDGLNRIRDVMERSITAVGLHVTEGAALWEMYREFENAMLQNLQPAPGSVSTAEQQEKIKKQSNKIKTLFKRQLAIPLLDMQTTMQEYIEWCEDEIDSNTKVMYEKSLKQFEELKPFEDALLQTASPKLEEYQNYIQHEIKLGALERVQCIYERALVENCLNSDFWIQYLKYMSYQIHSPKLLVDVHLRSVRNCPWTGQLWVLYLLALERNNANKEKLNDVFEEALSSGFTSASEYVVLWRTRCSQIRRRISNGSEEIEELRETFVKATNYINDKLYPAFDDTGDDNYSMWTFWARCEAGCLKNHNKAVDILQTLTQDNADARRKICIWREWYNIERLYGGDDKLDKCRSILRQAVQNCAILPNSERGGIPDAEVACEMLLDFEREFGNIEEMDESRRRVTNKMSKVTKRREKDAASASAYIQRPRKKEWQPRQQKGNKQSGPMKRKSSGEDKSHDKKGDHGGYHEEQKRMKTEESPSTSSSGFKTPAGLPVRYGNESKSPSKPTAVSSTGSKPPPGFKGPPPGFKNKPPPGFKGQIMPSDRNNNKSQDISSHDAEPESDNKTIFVSNLDFKLENIEEKLQEIFSKCGKIDEIRVARSHNGNFRGFVFIQFTDENSAKEALKLDRQHINTRPMFVSPNVDKKKHPNFKIFRYEVGLEKHKLFISNLSFKTTEETLREEFGKHGTLKALRIVTNRSGQSKGLAYLEYENESEAAQALLKVDGKEIDGFNVKVEISNPPKRNPQSGDQSKSLLGGGDGRQFQGSRGRGRTQLSLLPRSISQSSSKKTQNGDSSNSSSGGMSNKDFAKLLNK